MPQTIEPPTRTRPHVALPRAHWTVRQFEGLFSMGLMPHNHFELINGEVIENMPIKRFHGNRHAALIALISRIFGAKYVSAPTSVQIGDDGLPEPDAIVTNKPIDDESGDEYWTNADVQIAVEVAKATIDGDLTTKAALYGGAGIPEYWVLDINARKLYLHTLPNATGYGNVALYEENEIVISPSAPQYPFNLAEILP